MYVSGYLAIQEYRLRNAAWHARLDVSTVGGESEVQEHHAISTALHEKTNEEAREALGCTNATRGFN